jgi:hypothetical protein
MSRSTTVAESEMKAGAARSASAIFSSVVGSLSLGMAAALHLVTSEGRTRLDCRRGSHLTGNEPVKRDLARFCSGESIMAQRRTVLPAVLADAHPTRDVAWQHGPYTVQV